MAIELDDFLKKYYRRLHTKAMPDAVLEQLVEDKGKGLLTGHQEEWFTNWLEKDDNAPHGWRAKPVPEPSDENELPEAELKKLFKAFTLALAGMKSNKIFWDSKNDASAIAFVNRWTETGERPVFQIPQPTKECERGIKEIFNFLKTHPQANEIKDIILKDTKKANGEKVFSSDSDLEKFIRENTGSTPKYKTDTRRQVKMQQVATTLYNYMNRWGYTGNTAEEGKKQALATISNALSTVAQEDAFTEIDETGLDDFKNKYAKELLDTLYYNKNIRDRFAEYDTMYEVTKKITKAEGKISWHDPKHDDYVKPKIEDTRSPLQQLKKWATDTYGDTLKKYEELRGGHLFFNYHAKEIFKKIDKKGIKPTDGLNGLLDKAADIKKDLPNKIVEQHFDWFVETMNSIKGEIPNAIDGAWRNASQMKAIIDQIILRATNPDPRNFDPLAMEKAKTAMEIMTAMKYGMLSSRVMNAIKDTDFTIFSDKDLSWNNNDAMKFITGAFDKGIKAAFMGIGYFVTFVGNSFYLSGRKYTNSDNKSGALAQRFKEEQEDINKYGPDAKKSLRDFIAKQKSEIPNKQQIIDNLVNAGFKLEDAEKEYKKAEAALKPSKDDIDKAKAAVDEAQKEVNQLQDTMNQNSHAKKRYDELNDIIVNDGDIKDLQKQENDIINRTQEIQEILKDPSKATQNIRVTDPETLRRILQDLSKQQQVIQDKINELRNDKDRITNATNERESLKTQYGIYNAAETKLNAATTKLTDAKTALTTAENKYKTEAAQIFYNGYNFDDLNKKIEEFKKAEKDIKEINETTQKKQAALDNWDAEHVNKVLELENYWNFLQGHATTWAFNTKTEQKKFDKTKENALLTFNKRYGLSA